MLTIERARPLCELFEGSRVSLRARIEDEFGNVETYWGVIDGMGSAENDDGKDEDFILLTQGGRNRKVQVWIPIKTVESLEIEF